MRLRPRADAMGDEQRILVAGAGPVGLTAALALARAGMKVALFERRDSANQTSLASTFHSPTIEMLEDLGAARGLLRDGQQVPAISYFDHGRLAVRLDMSLLAAQTRHPGRWHYEQGRLCLDILTLLRGMPNVALHFGAPVKAARTLADTVELQLENGTVERGAFMVAADGARSTVRESLGISFEGIDYPARVLRIMTSADLRHFLPQAEPISYLYCGERSVSLLKMPEVWRIVYRLGADESAESALDDARIRQRLADTFGPFIGAAAPSAAAAQLPVTYKDVYSASRRVAGAWRAGRVLLAGDAVHVTNTRGGMNMNCGIHDAVAAAHAIVSAMHAGADPDAPLQAYAAERAGVAREQLIPRTDGNISAGRKRLEQMQTLAADPAALTAYLTRASMLDMLPACHHPSHRESTH